MTNSLSETAPLPVTVVSGFLGAGKTTLINGILGGSHGMRIAVLVNDFGDIAIDQTLIVHESDDVIALANGCMCCQIGGALYETIDRILRMRSKFDHLLIETSGVADPQKISQIAVAEPELEMRQTVVLVDALNYHDVLDDLRLADTWIRQVRNASVILVSKLDLAANHELEALTKLLLERDVRAPLLPIPNDAKFVELLHQDCETGNPSVGHAWAAPLRPHIVPFKSWSSDNDQEWTYEALRKYLEDTCQGVYRMKGTVRMADGSVALVQKAGRQLSIETAGPHMTVTGLVAIEKTRN